MATRNIVIRQHVEEAKVQRAKELRQQMTEEERTLWDQLRGNQLRGLHFRRQQVIAGFIVDFYCHSCALAIEVDGEIHANQVDYDAARDCALEERGIRVLRVTNDAVRHRLPEVLARVAEACET